MIIRIVIVIDGGIAYVFFTLPLFGKHFRSIVVGIDSTIESDGRVAANTAGVVFARVVGRVEGIGTVWQRTGNQSICESVSQSPLNRYANQNKSNFV